MIGTARPVTTLTSPAFALPNVYLRHADPDALRAMGFPNEAPDVYRQKNTVFFNYWLRDAGRLSPLFPGPERTRRFLRRLVERLPYGNEALRFLRGPAHQDASTVPGIERVLLDNEGKADPNSAKVLRREGQAPTGDTINDKLFFNAGLAVKQANGLITEVNKTLARMYPALTVDINMLRGALILCINHDPEQADNLGWPNAAAVPIEKGVGLVLFGLLRQEAEKAVFEDSRTSFSVLWHELGHLVRNEIRGFTPYTDIAGAVNEAYADLFSLMMQQVVTHGNKPFPDGTKPEHWSRWAIGLDFLKPLKIKLADGTTQERQAAIRQFYAKAFEGHPLMGDDASLHDLPRLDASETEEQSPFFAEECTFDEGGVHIKAASINKAHYLMITKIFEGMAFPAMLLFSTSMGIAKVNGYPTDDLHQLAWLEILAATQLFGAEKAAQVRKVWEDDMKVTGVQLNDPLPVPEQQA
ncbi:MAG: hypothetical protein ACD_62C00538G0006 [uncultured bacterium]|nr:MAG: hypothetical protein ACD_62C00538G0006 [uncultured bacterium]HLD44399.1 M4 family metallopeptidase [bacterium]